MCLSAGAMMALGLAGTAASTVMQNQAQKKQMKRYNDDVAAQNRLLGQQFQDRQNKINAGRDEQARLFQQIANTQDAEFQKQSEIAKQKQMLLQDAVQQDALKGANAQQFQEAVNERNQLFQETGVTPDFAPMGADTAENRVMRAAAEKASAKEKEKTEGMVGALSKMGAMEDVAQKQAQLFRDLNTGLTDKATDAQASGRLNDFALRAPQYRMGAVGNAIGEQATMPYFRGQEPGFQPPNTLFADVLGGASQLASLYSFYQQPPVPGVPHSGGGTISLLGAR